MSVYVKTQNHGTLNLRASPSSSSPVIATIPDGTEIPAEKINDTWSKTTYKNKEGFVMNKFLSTEEPGVSSTVSKEQLQKIYNSLKSTLQLIDEVLK